MTTIPNSATGILTASVEKGQADGTTIVGVTGGVATSATIPPIDLGTFSCTPSG